MPNGLEISRQASPRLVSRESQTLGWPDRSKIPGALRQAQGRLRRGGSIELLGRPRI